MVGSYLMTMPLHAITEVYGEAGLRDRFLGEIDALPEADRELLVTALALADRLHRDDRRTREPYLNHLLRVAIRILRYYDVRDPEVLVAALLHDSVEDHPVELITGEPAGSGGSDDGGVPTDERARQVAALGVLARRFGARVADLVAAVTNPPRDPARDRYEQYREHVEASLRRHPWARVIKISDFTDNGVGVIHSTGPKVISSAIKYRPLVPVLRELVALADTPLSEDAKRHVLDQLDLAEERFSAILDA